MHLQGLHARGAFGRHLPPLLQHANKASHRNLNLEAKAKACPGLFCRDPTGQVVLEVEIAVCRLVLIE
jgi:hypothetical protein